MKLIYSVFLCEFQRLHSAGLECFARVSWRLLSFSRSARSLRMCSMCSSYSARSDGSTRMYASALCLARALYSSSVCPCASHAASTGVIPFPRLSNMWYQSFSVGTSSTSSAIIAIVSCVSCRFRSFLCPTASVVVAVSICACSRWSSVRSVILSAMSSLAVPDCLHVRSISTFLSLIVCSSARM